MLPVNQTNIYLDNNATTKLSPHVKRTIRSVIDLPLGNPSSPHHFSDTSRRIIQDSKESISKFLNCSTSNIIFTSGATEANSMILQSLLSLKGPRTLITTVGEHASVLNNAAYLKEQGVNVLTIGVDSRGIIDEEEYLKALEVFGTLLVSIAWTNSETGVVQNIERLSSLAKKRNAFFHTDASQAIGRIRIDFSNPNIDFLSFTGHKLHAPKGIGLLLSKQNSFLKPLLIGGEQENELRAGTENVIHIAALGAAIEYRDKNFERITNKLKKIRDTFENEIKNSLTNVSINGNRESRVPNTTNLLFNGLPAQALLARLDSRGIYCSQTSACTSMIPEPSKILLSMGLSVDDAFTSYRFSFAEDNSMREVYKAVKIIIQEVLHLQKNPIWRDL